MPEIHQHGSLELLWGEHDELLGLISMRRNPGYEDAEWLAIWVPWNLRNLATSCGRLLRAAAAGVLRRDRAKAEALSPMTPPSGCASQARS